MTELVNRSDVYGHALFCDDIRFEVDGKASYIGVYSGSMRVHEPFPFTLPKLGIVVDVRQRKTVFQTDITLHIWLPGDADNSPFIVSQSQGTGLKANANPKLPFLSRKIYLVLSSLPISCAGLIRARMLIGEKHYPLGTLRVEQGPIDEEPSLREEGFEASEDRNVSP